MKQKSLFVIVAAAMLLVSCGGQSQPAAQAAEPVQLEQAPVVAQELPTEGAMEEAAPVEEAPAVEQAPASSNGTMTFTAPQDLFTLEIPDNWTAERDTAMIEDTQIDTYTAPDGHAFVQSLVNSTEEGTSAVLKAQYTRDYMKRLYGSDLRFASDVSLADGREKLEWWSDMSKTTGTTYFSTKDGYLYFATTAYEDAYESDYKSVLQDVADSYSE